MRAEIEAFCARIGADRLLVQGAGGNVSWKDDDGWLWVKASGTWLQQATSRPIFVPVPLEPARAAIRARAASIDVEAPGGLRPSIETLLHALLPQRIVVHLHAVDVLAGLVRRNGIRECEQRLAGFGWQHASIRYAKPGPALAAGVERALAACPDAALLLLENHGIVVAGGSLQEIDAMLADIGVRFAPPALYLPDAPAAPATIAAGDGIMLAPVRDPAGHFHSLASDPQWLRRLQQDWALYPDHPVFLGREAAIHADLREAIAAARAGRMLPGRPQFIAGVGTFSVSPLSAARLAQLRCYQDVLERQSADSVLDSLPVHEVDQLLDWEAEKYRQSLAVTG